MGEAGGQGARIRKLLFGLHVHGQLRPHGGQITRRVCQIFFFNRGKIDLGVLGNGPAPQMASPAGLYWYPGRPVEMGFWLGVSCTV